MSRSFKRDWRTQEVLNGGKVKCARRGCLDKDCEWCRRDRTIQQLREVDRLNVPDAPDEAPAVDFGGPDPAY